jgi:hypothetical protein
LDSLWVGRQGSSSYPGVLQVVGGALLNSAGALNGLIVEKGNVGIGITTPTQKLDVSGQVRATDVCTTAGTCLSTTGGGSSKWTDSGNNIYNKNTGNVGIGITTPTQKLDVSGQVKATEVCIPGKCLSSCLTSAPCSYWTGSGSNIYNNNSGNVGIGTNDPATYKLNVNGALRVNENISVGGNINLSGSTRRITNLEDPILSTDAVTKSYVDNDHPVCHAEESTITLTSGGNGRVWGVFCNSNEIVVNGGITCVPGGSMCPTGSYFQNVYMTSYIGGSFNNWVCAAYYYTVIPGQTKNLTCRALCCSGF